MKIIVHRGSHQVGGVAVEYATETTRILVDMGEELSMNPDFVSTPMNIEGVTTGTAECNAVLFTHCHEDHTGQMARIHPDIPLYTGALTKAIMELRCRPEMKERIQSLHTFEPGKPLQIRDIVITPYTIDHSAADSSMFLIEADGKRVLHTGDFRLHGFRRKGMLKILDYWIKKVDVLVTEGTTIARTSQQQVTERDLQNQLRQYIREYKYVFVLCASTNIDRVFSACNAVPRGKHFLVDKYQYNIMKLVQKHLAPYSAFYQNTKFHPYKPEKLDRYKRQGLVMMVRDNAAFRKIIPLFDPEKSVILYSMWDGYRTQPGSTIPSFLKLAGRWESLHTSGHASAEDIGIVIEKCHPDAVIPIHTDHPDRMKSLYPGWNIVHLNDGEPYQCH